MIPSFKYRSNEPELMDLPGADPVELNKTLNYIRFVNRVLGGDGLLIHGLNQFIRNQPEKKHWHILDIGCGRGDQLEVLNKWAQRQNAKITLAGLDNNPENIRLARQNAQLSDVSWYCSDAMSQEFDYSQFDLVCCTLFLHHLSDSEAVQLLRVLNKTKTQVLINDLHRSPLAWILFKCFAYLTNAPSMAKHDGALSVRKGFKKSELERMINKSGFKKLVLKWKWAFRYQVLLGHE